MVNQTFTYSVAFLVTLVVLLGCTYSLNALRPNDQTPIQPEVHVGSLQPYGHGAAEVAPAAMDRASAAAGEQQQKDGAASPEVMKGGEEKSQATQDDKQGSPPQKAKQLRGGRGNSELQQVPDQAQGSGNVQESQTGGSPGVPVSHLDAGAESHENNVLEDDDTGCSWMFHAGKFLGGIAGKSDKEVSKEKALAQCADLGWECAGITCTLLGKRTQCTPRQGVPWLELSPGGEVSYTKFGCQGLSPDEAAGGAASNGEIPKLGPTPQTGVEELPPLEPGRAVLVVVAHNRPDDLTRCLNALLAQDGLDTFSLALSLDEPSAFSRMQAVVTRLAGSRHIDIWKKTKASASGASAAIKIAAHFGFALTQAFDVNGFEYAAFVEGDLEVSPDFVWYFRLAAPLLEADPSLFCVSAFHDNGFKGLARDERRLFRTDYFPGLGWMIRKDTWDLLRDKWPLKPTTGWDHWMRHGAGLEGRECIAPEVPRTKHFGEAGANVKKGTGILRQLERMTSSSLAPGVLHNLSYLLKDNYEAQFRAIVQKAELHNSFPLRGLRTLPADRVHLVMYVRENYKPLATQLQLIQSQPRAGHHGVITTRHPRTGAAMLLVDRRHGEGVLQAEELWKPHPDRQVGHAKPGQSCQDFCLELHLECSERELEFVNDCYYLKQHFPCENGCGHQVGQEIPCYVHDRARDTALQCLVTDDVLPSCAARHASTTRLCACAPQHAAGSSG